MAGLNVTHQAIFTAELHDRLLSGRTVCPSASRRQSKSAMSPTSPTQSPVATTSDLGATTTQAGPSDLKRMLSSTLTFFAKTYASEFGFTRGPPVHDMLAIAYIIDPTLFYRRVPSPGDVPNVGMYDADPHSNKDVHVAKTQRGSGSNSLGLEPSTLGAAIGEAQDSTPNTADTATDLQGTPPKRYRVDVECSDGLACGATVVDFWGDRVEHDGWGRGGRKCRGARELGLPCALGRLLPSGGAS